MDIKSEKEKIKKTIEIPKSY